MFGADFERRALDIIALAVDPDDMRVMAKNAQGKSSLVVRAALHRIIELESKGAAGSVESDCWSMILAVEEIRRHTRGRKSPMNRLRPKIAKDGEIAALEYLALHESDGFHEVLEYGMPQLAAEAIVIRHGTPTFSSRAVEKARERLKSVGLDPDAVAHSPR